MKKFLTVLLALSVVFTYTVGTAFAVTEPSAENKTKFDTLVDEAVKTMTNNLNTDFDKAVRLFDGTEEIETGFTTTVANWEKAAAEYKTAYLEKLEDRAYEMKQLYAGDTEKFDSDIEEYSKANLDKVIALFAADATKAAQGTDFETTKVVTAADFNALYDAIKADGDVKLEAAKLAFADAKTAAERVLAAAKADLPINYSQTVQTIGGVQTSYYAMASAFVTEQETALAEIYLDATAKTATIATKVNADIKAITDSFTKGAYDIYTITKGKVANLLTIAEEKGSGTDLAIAKNAAMTAVNSKIDTYYETAGNKTAAGIARADAYKTIWTWLINEAETVEELKAVAGDTTDSHAKILAISAMTVDTYYTVDNAAAINELKDYAAKSKADRDADKVDAVVEKATVEAYKAAVANPSAKWGGLAAAKAEIRDNCYPLDAKTKYEVDKKKAEIEKKRSDLLEAREYYAPELAAVNAFYDDLLAKVDAAKTDKEVKAIVVPESTTARTKEQVQNIVKSFAAYKTDLAKLQGYMEYLNHGLKTSDPNYRDFSGYDLADFYAENGVRANADITAALYQQAQADLEKVKTNKEVADAKTAVETLIATLPATITVADKDAVVAAWEALTAYKEYGKTAISNEAKLNTAIGDLFNAERRAAGLLYLALPANPGAADKAAVKAYGEAIKAIDDNCGADKLYGAAKNVTNDINQYKAAMTSVKAAELKAVKDAINAIPLNVTKDDQTAIEAARALYDAYVDEYSVLTDGEKFALKTTAYNAADDVTNKAELIAAEAALKDAIKKYTIKSVESLKIKASSKLYKGKKIQVKWKIAGGDATKIDGYQVYKSTKANSGYKFMGKTKKLSMDNKKSLKKGTRYFYKVRAYVDVDGTRYYSDWSNKANRIYKK